MATTGGGGDDDLAPALPTEGSKEWESDRNSAPKMTTRQRIYLFYVLVAMATIYIMNQLDRYLIAVLTGTIALDLDYGNQVCEADATVTSSQNESQACSHFLNSTQCLALENQDGEDVCSWIYNGLGYMYDLLVGPVFTVTYTLAGLILGLTADLYNRKNLLMACLVVWSLATVLSGAANAYWQLALLRFILGMGEGGCSPFAVSLIGDYFPATMRATALGFYNLGIYVGYSLAFALGTAISAALGWRYAYYICGGIGIGLGFIFLFTVKEPERQGSGSNNDAEIREFLGGEEVTLCKKVLVVLKSFANPSLVVVCIAGSIRNMAGYAWGYYVYILFEAVGQTATEVAFYLSWIPIVGGCFSVIVGGIVADKITAKLGPRSRLAVIAASLILAAPFGLMTVWLDPPTAYYTLIPTYIFGELWVGVTLAVIIELVPSSLRGSSVALYFFIISNIGGLGPLIVTPIENAFKSTGMDTATAIRYVLTILYPGFYVLAALFFILAIFVIKRDMDRLQLKSYEEIR